MKYADLNGDGTINDNDRYNAGNGVPKLTGGLFFDGATGRIRLRAELSAAAYGCKIYNAVKLLDGANGRPEQLARRPEALDAHEPEHDDAARRLRCRRRRERDVVSDRWLESGELYAAQEHHRRLHAPDRGRAAVRSRDRTTALYLNLQNLYTWTKYSGWDPEILGFGDPLARGIDDGFIYPNPRTITIGLDLRL